MKGKNMAYLIMMCEELGDQWECDANRTPMCIVEDYETFNDNTIIVDGIKQSYRWEAYIINDNNTIGECVKHYDEYLDEGMAFVCWVYDENGHIIDLNVIKAWQNYTRNDSIPTEVKKQLEGIEEFDDSLKWCGYISWNVDNNHYVYGEYHDDVYELGY